MSSATAPAPETATHPSLEIRDADGKISRVDLVESNNIIGRAIDASIRLDHGMVSRQHAQLTLDGAGRLRVRDMSSRNGTLVNGRAVMERQLTAGDQITIGPFTLTVLMPALNLTETGLTRLAVTEGAAGRISTLDDVGSPRVQAAHLMMINDLGQRLLITDAAAERSVQLCKLMVGPQFHGKWAALLRVDAADDKIEEPLLLSEACVAGNQRHEPYLSRGVLRALRDKKEAVIASNVAQQTDLMMSISPSVMPLATIACPLVIEKDHLDLLYVMLPPEYGTGEWLALAVLAAKQYQQAESAWASRKKAEAHAVMERDLDRARQIQMRLIPRDPVVEGLDLAIGFAPCRGVGGDYVDIAKTADGRTLLAVADVCGKGLPASLVASSIHTMVHASLLGGMSLSKMINTLNQYLRDHVPIDAFVTMIAVLVDASTGEIEYVNAGHPPPLIVTRDNQTRLLKMAENMPLRIETDLIESYRDTFAPGDLLALYTDGLTEMGVGERDLVGIAGLCAEMQKIYTGPGVTAHDAAAALTRRMNELQGTHDPLDDRTFLLVRRMG